MTIDQQRDAVSQALRGAPPAPRHDTLWVLMAAHTAGDTQHFQATLRQQGTALLFDSFCRPELIRAADVQMLRSSYDGHIRMIHELAAEGLPLSSHTLDTQQLYDLGRRVAAVLPTAVRQGIVAALRRARLRRRGLCIVLEVAAEAQELLSIPWELMVLPLADDARTDVDGFLLLNADVSLVRQVQGIGRNTPPRLARPLKLQAFAATPHNVEPIDIETTRAALAQALPNGGLEDCWYDGPDTLGALQDRLREASPQIVHLLCHGEQNDVGRGPLRSDLLLTHRDGYMQRANTFDLAPILTLAPDIQLVILHACHAGATATAPQSAGHGDAEHGAAESIALGFVQHGVPVVVAIQGAIGQQAAGAFVRACYAALAHGAGIGQAVAAGRVAIWAAGGLVDWSLPVIYQGSGQPEPETWHTRLADRLDGALHDPTTKRELRGGLVTLALALLTTAVRQGPGGPGDHRGGAAWHPRPCRPERHGTPRGATRAVDGRVPRLYDRGCSWTSGAGVALGDGPAGARAQGRPGAVRRRAAGGPVRELRRRALADALGAGAGALRARAVRWLDTGDRPGRDACAPRGAIRPFAAGDVVLVPTRAGP